MPLSEDATLEPLPESSLSAEAAAGSGPSLLSPPPFMKLTNFINIIISRTKISMTTLVVALYYLRKLKLKHPVCKGSPGSSHRLILAAIVIASKYLYDDTFDNKAWASVSSGYFKTTEVNKMECELLYYLDYSLYVGVKEWGEFTEELGMDLREYMEGFLRRGPRRYGKSQHHTLEKELSIYDVAEEFYSKTSSRAGPPHLGSQLPINVHDERGK